MSKIEKKTQMTATEEMILKYLDSLNETLKHRDKELYEYIREKVEAIHKYIEKLETSFENKINIFETKMTKVYAELRDTDSRLIKNENDIKRVSDDWTYFYSKHRRLLEQVNKNKDDIEKLKIQKDYEEKYEEKIEEEKNEEKEKKNKILWGWIIGIGAPVTTTVIILFGKAFFKAVIKFMWG